MSEKIFKNKTAKDLFPALFEEISDDTLLEIKEIIPQQQTKSPVRNIEPKPPDVNWLRTKEIDDQSKTEANIPKALVLTNNKENLTIYTTVFKNFGYAVEYVHSEAAVIKSVSSSSYSIILYENSLELKHFEQYMRNLSGAKRRNVFYIIIGSELKTLYDLEALCLSANIVVNSKDIRYLNVILKKGFKDYEVLYGPFLETLASVRGSRHG